ncbi:hypothetical protein FACS1894104_1880 [Actinomycetota bacterium]|nr:hypothetical protein FACS1894104_1880 [Actinomycetota bacterium]
MVDKRTIRLVRKAKRGDRAAFDQLCDLKVNSIIFTAKVILGNLQDAEDAAQETLIVMFNEIHNLRSPSAVDAWIMTITRNICNKILRHNITRRQQLDVDDEAVQDNLAETNIEFLPEAYANNKDLSAELFNIIMGLPVKRREMLLLYYYNDLSYKEISEVTGKALGTVSTNIMKARSDIKAKIEELEAARGAGSNDGGDTVNKLAAGIGAVPVITQVLNQQQEIQVPPSSTAKVLEDYQQAVLGSELAGSVLARKIVGAIVTSVVVVVTAFAVAFCLDAQQPQVQYITIEAPEISGNGTIEFISAGSDEHVNPIQAGLEGIDDDLPIANTTWTILRTASATNSTTGTVIAHGEGTTVTTELAHLSQTGQTGSYSMVYEVTFESGGSVQKNRPFIVE